MGRPHRLMPPGAIYHVFDRGNDRQKIFMDDLERREFLRFTGVLKGRYGFKLYAYVLMPNHFHFILHPVDGTMPRIMQVLKTVYTQVFNTRHGKVGHLFQGRYKSIVVQDDRYLFELLSYVHLNPCKKRKPEYLDEYKWSSHAEFIGLVKTRLADDDLLKRFYSADGRIDLKGYKRYLGHAHETDPRWLDRHMEKLLAGTKDFVDEVLKQAESGGRSFPGWAKRGDYADSGMILERTAEEFGVSVEEMLSKRGKWNHAKKAAIYLLWTNTAMSPMQIAALFPRQHPSTIKRAAMRLRADMDNSGELETKISAIQQKIRLCKKGV